MKRKKLKLKKKPILKKKIKLKKKLPVILQEEIKEPDLLFAKNAQPGIQYINWNLNSIFELDGIKNEKIVFNVRDLHGNLLKIDVVSHYPILQNAKLLKEIMEKHTYKRQLELSKITGKNVDIIINKKTGEIKKKRTSNFGGKEKDSKTGCVLGTTSHRMGEIMLKIGLTANKKKKCLETMFGILKEQFDEKKAKGLASSWYSTHRRNKPEIYVPKT